MTSDNHRELSKIDTCNDLLQEIENPPVKQEHPDDFDVAIMTEIRQDILDLKEKLKNANISGRIELPYRIYTNACKAEMKGFYRFKHLECFKESFGYELGVQAVVEYQNSTDTPTDVQETA